MLRRRTPKKISCWLGFEPEHELEFGRELWAQRTRGRRGRISRLSVTPPILSSCPTGPEASALLPAGPPAMFTWSESQEFSSDWQVIQEPQITDENQTRSGTPSFVSPLTPRIRSPPLDHIGSHGRKATEIARCQLTTTPPTARQRAQ
jgi:hypothetical protein